MARITSTDWVPPPDHHDLGFVPSVYLAMALPRISSSRSPTSFRTLLIGSYNNIFLRTPGRPFQFQNVRINQDVIFPRLTIHFRVCVSLDSGQPNPKRFEGTDR